MYLLHHWYYDTNHPYEFQSLATGATVIHFFVQWTFHYIKYNYPVIRLKQVLHLIWKQCCCGEILLWSCCFEFGKQIFVANGCISCWNGRHRTWYGFSYQVYRFPYQVWAHLCTEQFESVGGIILFVLDIYLNLINHGYLITKSHNVFTNHNHNKVFAKFWLTIHYNKGGWAARFADVGTGVRELSLHTLNVIN